MSIPDSKRCRTHGTWAMAIAAVLSVAGDSRGSDDGFSIVRSTFAAGGGTSAGGDFVVASTIAQPEAGGPLVDGGVSVAGGFRAQVASAVSEEGPTLHISLSESGLITISWSPATPGFVLQESLTLSPAVWLNSASGPANPISLPASGPARFYRLGKP